MGSGWTQTPLGKGSSRRTLLTLKLGSRGHASFVETWKVSEFQRLAQSLALIFLAAMEAACPSKNIALVLAIRFLILAD
jgi:hypothetical protein